MQCNFPSLGKLNQKHGLTDSCHSGIDIMLISNLYVITSVSFDVISNMYMYFVHMAIIYVRLDV